ncbi:MAG: 16S rRNA (guanine(527)-N(7))-methyltransferase RsmG [Lachnotalea sp.]
MDKYNIELFNKGLESLEIKLSEDQINQFISYYELLTEWNSVMNLTTITEFDDVIQKHFIDSLAIVKAVDLNETIKIIDVGTGAGFPGIPLKIAFPHLEIVLLDSLNKKIKFLNEVIDKLQLKNIKAIHGRAEDFSRDIEYREKFDLCVSRAVANLSSLAEYCMPYVKMKGNFISYKSGKIAEELLSSKKAIHVLGGKIEEEVLFSLPNTDIERTFVNIRKMQSTPKLYPRKAGIPTKDPIC